MRRQWDGVHAALVHSVSTLQAEQRFRGWRLTADAPSRFDCPLALASFLTGRDGARDDKDKLLTSLITAVQHNGPACDLAWDLLWLSMWPALDHCYRRRLRLFSREPEELVSLISVSFTTLVASMDLKRVRRVAATLAMSTDRDVLNACRKRWADERRLTGLLDDADTEGTHAGRRSRKPPLVAALDVSNEAQIASVRTRLRRIVGDDADLLIDVVIVGFNARELADRSGQNHEAVRKRYSRAKHRVRWAMSHSSSQDGVSSAGPGGPRRRER